MTVHTRGPRHVRTIRLPCYGITIRLARENACDAPGCGTITSNLREALCQARGVLFNAAINALESLILAHACARIDVESAAVDAVENAI